MYINYKTFKIKTYTLDISYILKDEGAKITILSDKLIDCGQEDIRDNIIIRQANKLNLIENNKMFIIRLTGNASNEKFHNIMNKDILKHYENKYNFKTIYIINDGEAILASNLSIDKLFPKNMRITHKTITALKMPSKKLSGFARILIVNPKKTNSNYIMNNKVHKSFEFEPFDGIGYVKQSFYNKLTEGEYKTYGAKITGYANIKGLERIKGNIKPVANFKDIIKRYTNDKVSDFDMQFCDWIADTNQFKGAKPGFYRVSLKYVGLHQIFSMNYRKNNISFGTQILRSRGEKYMNELKERAKEINNELIEMYNGNQETRDKILNYVDDDIKDNIMDAIIHTENIKNEYKKAVKRMLIGYKFPMNNLFVRNTAFNCIRGYVRSKLLKGSKIKGYMGYIEPIEDHFKMIDGKLYPVSIVYDQYSEKYFTGLAVFIAYPFLHQYCEFKTYCMSKEQYENETGRRIPEVIDSIAVSSSYAKFANRDFDGDIGYIVLNKLDNYVEKEIKPVLPIKPQEVKSKDILENMLLVCKNREKIAPLDSYLTSCVIENFNTSQQEIYDIALAIQYRIDSAKGAEISDKIKAEFFPFYALATSTYRGNLASTTRKIEIALQDKRTPEEFKNLFKTMLCLAENNKHNIISCNSFKYDYRQDNEEKLIQAETLTKKIRNIFTINISKNRTSYGLSIDATTEVYDSIARLMGLAYYDKFYNITANIEELKEKLFLMAIINTCDERSTVMPFIIARDLGILDDVIEKYLNVTGTFFESNYIPIAHTYKPLRTDKINQEKIIEIVNFNKKIEQKDTRMIKDPRIKNNIIYV